MNGVIVFSNDEICPKNTKKLSKNIVVMDKNITDFENMDQSEFDNGGFYLLKNSGLEPKLMTLCEYNNVAGTKTIPKGYYFTVKNKCPSNSEQLGQIGILDFAKSSLVFNPANEKQTDKMLKEINTLTDRNRKTTAYIKEMGTPFLDYNWVLPQLCKAKADIPIDSNIVLPASRCNGSNWTDVGTYGMLGSIYDYDFNADNNIKLDITNTIFPNQQIILPRMCAGYPNIAIDTCLNKSDTRYKNKCDEDMRELCKTIEFGNDIACSCINAKTRLIGNPLYIDTVCIQNGYKTSEMKADNNFTASKINCDALAKFRKNNPDYPIEDNRYTQFCKVPDVPHEPRPPKQIIEPKHTKYIILVCVAVIFCIFFYYKGIPFLKKLKTKISFSG